MSKLNCLFAASLIFAACGSSSKGTDGGGGITLPDGHAGNGGSGGSGGSGGTGGTGGTGGSGGVDAAMTQNGCVVLCGTGNTCPNMFTNFTISNTCVCAPATGSNPTTQGSQCNTTTGQGCVCSQTVACPVAADTCITVNVSGTTNTGPFCSNSCPTPGADNTACALMAGAPGSGFCVQFTLMKYGPHGENEWVPDPNQRLTP
jgi:hypothetical protein